jgi:hypothetical protein
MSTHGHLLGHTYIVEKPEHPKNAIAVKTFNEKNAPRLAKPFLVLSLHAQLQPQMSSGMRNVYIP